MTHQETCENFKIFVKEEIDTICEKIEKRHDKNHDWVQGLKEKKYREFLTELIKIHMILINYSESIK